jgi:Ca-activated chloride channel homolog
MDRLNPGPAGQLIADWGTRWNPEVQWVRLRWPVFGYLHPEATTLPDLERVELPTPRGMPVSLTRQFDREFLFSRGASPPILNAADSGSRHLTVPLSSETSSWERVRSQLQQSQLPPTDQLHAEDFLAALDYRLAPAEPGKLALRSAAGVSVFNPSPAGLLQISVKAGEPRPWPRPATHLAVALDLSASMDWDQRFAAAREGIVRALSSLRPDDRFSLIVFREEPQMLVSEARSGDLAAIFAALDRLQPAGSANVGEVLPQAIAAAFETEADLTIERRLVLLTDSPTFLLPEASAGMERVVRDAQAFGFDVLDLGDQSEPDEQILRLVQAAGGTFRRARTAAEIRRGLLDSLRGESPLVATGAQLNVDFNPQAVAAYRLIGHEPRGSGSFGPAVASAELAAGEEITALFEIWLHPNEVDDVAVAHLSWLAPDGDGRGGSESIRISRLQFSSTFEGMPVSLQQAAIIAEAVEVLSHSFNFEVHGMRGYRYAPKPRDLRHVFQVVERANPQLGQRADFQRMLGFLATADRISPERPVGSTRAGVRAVLAGRWRESRE